MLTLKIQISIASSKAMARQIELNSKQAELRLITTLLKQRRRLKAKRKQPKMKRIVASKRLGLMQKKD